VPKLDQNSETRTYIVQAYPLPELNLVVFTWSKLDHFEGQTDRRTHRHTRACPKTVPHRYNKRSNNKRLQMRLLRNF